LAFARTSSYERSPMQPRRTPFRITLDRLTQDFARAVFEAVRHATVAELLGMADTKAQRGAPPSTPAIARNASAPMPARRPAPKRVRPARPSPAAAPPVDEPLMPDGIEIDAQALLASIEPERVQVPTDQGERSMPEVLQPEPVPAPPASEPRATPSPTLREGEEALRTENGHVVLRRRRAAESAA
jgi:hypothetical protein